MSDLADVVLPLIRTRSELWRWGAANAHGSQMHHGIDLLEAAIPTTDPAQVYTVITKALASALSIIARADDSSGIIGDACRRLLELHPTAAAATRVPPSRLVEWMMTFQFGGVVDFFDIDPVAYAPALGERGMAAYRSRLEEVRAKLGPQPPDSEIVSGPDMHERWVLERNDRRLAVLDRDHVAIIRTHARDRRVAAWFQDTAKAFEEIGELDLALDWARQAMDVDPWHQATAAAEYWCRLLQEHRPQDLLQARLLVFRRWPSSTSAARLYSATGEAWPDHRDEVMATLAVRPSDAVLFALLTLTDVQLAWGLAHALSLEDDRTWSDLVTAYEKVDPLAVLPVHHRLVVQELVVADAQRYRQAARRLAKMRRLAAGTEMADEVDDLIAQLREEHRRRPRLQKELDRAGLPAATGR